MQFCPRGLVGVIVTKPLEPLTPRPLLGPGVQVEPYGSGSRPQTSPGARPPIVRSRGCHPGAHRVAFHVGKRTPTMEEIRDSDPLSQVATGLSGTSRFSLARLPPSPLSRRSDKTAPRGYVMRNADGYHSPSARHAEIVRFRGRLSIPRHGLFRPTPPHSPCEDPEHLALTDREIRGWFETVAAPVRTS